MACSTSVGKLETRVRGPQCGGLAGGLPRDRLDPDAEIRQRLVHHGGRGTSAPQRTAQPLRVRTGREHQVAATARRQGVDGSTMVRVVSVEKGDQNAGIEDDRRHSRRKPFR
jgi:hypothetical protein